VRNKKQYDGDVFHAFCSVQQDGLNYRIEARQMLRECLENKKILDIGCGTGIDLQYFSAKKAEVYGVDISTPMVNAAKKRTKNAEIILTDYSCLPFKENFFDMVFSQFSLEHEGNLENVFQEVYRVLKLNGKLLLVVEHPMKQLFDKPNKNYFIQEEYKDTFFNGTVSVNVFSHMLSEYLSPFMLSRFRLIDFLEKTNPTDTLYDDFLYPGYMMLNFLKTEL